MEESRVNHCNKVVVIGGSAGSLEVLMQVIPRLQANVTIVIVIVLHRKAGEEAMLEQLFTAKSKMPVVEVEDKIALEPGSLYIAPADYHLLFENDGRLALDISEKVNYSRPSIDVTFESAAEVFGKKLIGILLSGSNSDGAKGLEMIREHGGSVVVQNPESAEMPYMPQSAVDRLVPDHILDVGHLYQFLSRL